MRTYTVNDIGVGARFVSTPWNPAHLVSNGSKAIQNPLKRHISLLIMPDSQPLVVDDVATNHFRT
jgi:hypothetical protein